MSQVIIRRCSVCPSIRSHTQATAATLKTELGIEPQIIDGAKGEFTVLVGERILAQNSGTTLPAAEQVIAAMRGTAPASTAAKWEPLGSPAPVG